MMQPKGSEAYSLALVDLKKIWTGAKFAVLMALIAYLSEQVIPHYMQDPSHIINYTIGVVGVVLVNFLRKYVNDTRDPPPPAVT